MSIEPDHLASAKDLQRRYRELLLGQPLAVLATQEPTHPYLSLMAFAVTEDGGGLLVATRRDTRKYRNLKADSRVSLLLDDRTNQTSDFQEAFSVTVLGQAEEVGPAERQRYLPVFLARHPHLAGFAAAPDCALIRIRIQHLYAVSRFQEVRELHP